jgi:DNA-binding response OmpR family regulator
VDDNRDAADTLALFLRLHGHDARAAYGGGQALAIVRDWQPDAAIVDVVMNGVGGIELASRLRRDATRPTVIVALTGVGTNDELVPVRAGTFDSVLLKPMDPDEVLRVLNACRGGDGRNEAAALLSTRTGSPEPLNGGTRSADALLATAHDHPIDKPQAAVRPARHPAAEIA